MEITQTPWSRVGASRTRRRKGDEHRSPPPPRRRAHERDQREDQPSDGGSPLEPAGASRTPPSDLAHSSSPRASLAGRLPAPAGDRWNGDEPAALGRHPPPSPRARAWSLCGTCGMASFRGIGDPGEGDAQHHEGTGASGGSLLEEVAPDALAPRRWRWPAGLPPAPPSAPPPPRGSPRSPRPARAHGESPRTPSTSCSRSRTSRPSPASSASPATWSTASR